MQQTSVAAIASSVFQHQVLKPALIVFVLVLGCSMWSTLRAQNEPDSATVRSRAKVIAAREHRLLQWYNADSKGGLFVHWGLGVGKPPGTLMYPDVKAFDKATADANWSPQPMVDAAVKLNCKYIIWATMHVEHGLTRTWKSTIPGTPVTKRDYLGELCSAAALKGIKIVVYICGDAALQKADVKAFIDGAAYARYKQANVDIKNNNDDWVRYFAKDVMFEIMDNYPNVVGFWGDGWNAPLPDNETLAAVHAKNPRYLIFRNEYSNQPSYDDVDVMGIEPFAKILSPCYDKASSMYVRSGNGVEGSFIISYDWWYTGKDFSADLRWSVKMMVSALGGNAVPCLAEGPGINGGFGEEINRTNDSLKRFVAYAFAAISNVWGGGYAHSGFAPGTTVNGAYIATTMSKDGNTHYVHVLNKSSTHPNQIVIPLLGYKIASVKSLDSDKGLDYSVADGRLVITVNSWAKFDEYGDEIIQITTAGKPAVLSRSAWRASVNNTDSNYPASNAIDSTHDTYYSSKSDAGTPVELTIDMGANNNIYGISLSQYEARALTTARYYPTNEGTRIKDYEVYASDDGSDWGTVIVAGTLTNERGVKSIEIPGGTGNKQHIKLRILSNYKGNGIVQITNIDLLKRQP